MIKRISSFLLATASTLPTSMAVATDNPQVIIETNRGAIVVELYPGKSPIATTNFLDLVDSGFYDGIIFHRVIAGFMIQAGGFDTKMNRREVEHTIKNEASNGISNETGTVAMAQVSGNPDSAGSQFFINVANNTFLDASTQSAGYTVFGKVIEGMTVVDDIEESETTALGPMNDVPKEQTVILSAKRIEKQKE